MVQLVNGCLVDSQQDQARQLLEAYEAIPGFCSLMLVRCVYATCDCRCVVVLPPAAASVVAAMTLGALCHRGCVAVCSLQCARGS